MFHLPGEKMKDYLFRGKLSELDPDVFELTELEAERQYRKLILIPSESQSPLSVREAMSSAFQNIYAEGYPREETRKLEQEEILDHAARLVHYRRYSDRRYYKGVEYADSVEMLARRRCAELFATPAISADHIYVNVQPLSGAPANNAVYTALVKPGDTIMGMDLLHGGHLTHGSPVNRSGKLYNAIHYTVDPVTEQINYDAVEELARQTSPKIIIAGYSSYPWAVDWKRFREIANSVNAYLFADIAHVAGLVAAGAYPSPVGYADIITFTTHKSLCGPRGGCVLTFEEGLSRDIDRAVFPGEQGGPHVNNFAAMAVAFKLAATDQFKQLQHQIVRNCAILAGRLQERGLRVPYGGTNTHLMNLATNTIVGKDGTGLSGEQAARILDISGIVVNRNTIPGDVSAADPSGVRMGTPWITQRGFEEAETTQLADIIADLLQATTPHMLGKVRRAKVDFGALEDIKLRVRDLAEKAGIDFEPTQHGFPHFYYLDDKPKAKDWAVMDITGDRVRLFLDYALTSDVDGLEPGKSQPTRLHTPKGVCTGTLTCVDTHLYRLTLPSEKSALAAAWLRDLSDGYVASDADLQRKLPGLTEIAESDAAPVIQAEGESVACCKPYYIGVTELPSKEGPARPAFEWQEVEAPVRRTPIYETHKNLGAKMIPFAGWEMPVWYTSVLEEHLAVRQAAGIFDVAHMGVYQVEGPDAAGFLDSVVANDVTFLQIGESCYTHLLDPDANVIDDLIVYRRGKEKILIVVNASNDDKDWAWLNAVKDGEVMVDNKRPWSRAFGRNVILRNLRDPKEGADMRVDIALQGPRSRKILVALANGDPRIKTIIFNLKRTHLTELSLGGFDLVISRTGYTGEKFSFELFVHPDRADALFNALLQVGEKLGLKPIGLGARDSLRTEAGLPLYGHEMGGEMNLGVADAGFGSFVKTYKPWFIGRDAFIEKEKNRKGQLIRFRFDEKGVRMAHNGDPIVDKRGRVVGHVTSCAVDQDGFLTGQGYVEIKSSEVGNILFIYQGASKEPGKILGNLKLGDRVIVPAPVHIERRFPKSK
jgi:glycine hydroxymethyltransferase